MAVGAHLIIGMICQHVLDLLLENFGLAQLAVDCLVEQRVDASMHFDAF
jgi:hypothetical protein